MLRVTPTESNGRSTFKLEGKLRGPWVDEMRQCWIRIAHLPRRVAVEVNLQEVSYVDERGRDLLLRMEREGASLVGASEFLRHLLHEDGRSPKKSLTQKRGKENTHGSSVRS
jgi:hypothetical protein